MRTNIEINKRKNKNVTKKKKNMYISKEIHRST